MSRLARPARTLALAASMIAGIALVVSSAAAQERFTLRKSSDREFDQRVRRAEEVRETPEVEDVSVFPMAMPMLAGPGAIASIMLLAGAAEGVEETLVVLAALLAVMVLTLLALWAASPLMKLVGAQVEAVITRLLGVLLAALAAQYVFDGIRGSFGL